MGKRLVAGEKMPNFSFITPYEKDRNVEETLKKVNGKTAFVFLRYFGCTSCQFDIRDYANRYDLVKATGGQILVALQSDPALVAEESKDLNLPYDIICDPEQTLYKEFDIPSMPPRDPNAQQAQPDMNDPAMAKLMAKFAKIKEMGLQHGKYEGNEAQLPALFVCEPDGTLSYVLYPQGIADMPDIEGIADLLK